jgi:hypothetical protein
MPNTRFTFIRRFFVSIGYKKAASLGKEQRCVVLIKAAISRAVAQKPAATLFLAYICVLKESRA